MSTIQIMTETTTQTTIAELIRHLETVAPPAYQESYDNAGLLCGDPGAPVRGVLTCLDSTEAVIEEAIDKGCNLVVAHHPIIFRGLKKLTGRGYVERVIIKAIRHDVAIYAIHTNLDNVYHQGVNAKIAERLGLTQTRVLAPKPDYQLLTAYVPTDERAALEQWLRDNQATAPSEPSFYELPTDGDGKGVSRLEAVVSAVRRGGLQKVLQNIPHTLTTVNNHSPLVGSGLVGELASPLAVPEFLAYLKERMAVHCIRHTTLLERPIQRVAVCGGAGGFLLSAAIGAGADVFVTADYKYHEFFDADGRIVIADIGHYESEQFTIELLSDILRQKFGNFAVLCTEVDTNPVHYYC